MREFLSSEEWAAKDKDGKECRDRWVLAIQEGQARRSTLGDVGGAGKQTKKRGPARDDKAIDAKLFSAEVMRS